MRRLAKVLAGLASGIGIAATPVGAEGPATPEPHGWHFRLAPYLWMAGLEGDVGVLSPGCRRPRWTRTSATSSTTRTSR
jgi:hypothetical protein